MLALRFVRWQKPQFPKPRAVATGLGTQSSRLLAGAPVLRLSSRDDCVPRPVATARGSDTIGVTAFQSRSGRKSAIMPALSLTTSAKFGEDIYEALSYCLDHWLARLCN